MRRIHIIIIFTAVLTAAFSAYSLAAMNQIYYVEYEWYSQYNNDFSKEFRDTYNDRWLLDENPQDFKAGVISDDFTLSKEQALCPYLQSVVTKEDLKDYVYLYCYIGKVHSPQYSTKFFNMAQRSNIVEIMVSLNSPDTIDNNICTRDYYPFDVVRISRDSFPLRGGMKFVFKDQNGAVLSEKSVEVK